MQDVVPLDREVLRDHRHLTPHGERAQLDEPLVPDDIGRDGSARDDAVAPGVEPSHLPMGHRDGDHVGGGELDPPMLTRSEDRHATRAGRARGEHALTLATNLHEGDLDSVGTRRPDETRTNLQGIFPVVDDLEARFNVRIVARLIRHHHPRDVPVGVDGDGGGGGGREKSGEDKREHESSFGTKAC